MALHPKGNYVLLTILNIMKGSFVKQIIEQLLPIVYDLALD